MTTPTTVRLVAWNILEGWHDLHQSPPLYQSDRAETARQLIERLNPDVVVLNEALWCCPYEKKHIDYGAFLGYPHQLAALYDTMWGNVILSRYPLLDTEEFHIHNRGGLRARIATPSGMLGVATYHPHPSRYPAHKAQDFRNLLRDTTQESWVVAGDFNAISPADHPYEVSLVHQFAKISPHPATSLSRFTEGGRQVFMVLEELGYMDAFSEPRRHPTMPTRLLAKPFGQIQDGIRIDHAWITTSVKVNRAEVIRHPWANLASDHYPLCLDLAPVVASG